MPTSDGEIQESLVTNKLRKSTPPGFQESKQTQLIPCQISNTSQKYPTVTVK